MVQFVHLPSNVLTGATRAANKALPIYTPIERAHIAARLRLGLASGRVTARDVLKAIDRSDYGVAGMGLRLAKHSLPYLASLRLPPELRAPIDPFFGPDRRRAISDWLVGFVARGLLSAGDVRAAASLGDIALVRLMDKALAAYGERMLRDVANQVGTSGIGDTNLKWTVNVACTTSLSNEYVRDVVMFPNDDVGFSVTLVDGIEATPLLIDVCDALSTVTSELINIEWPRTFISGGSYFGGLLIEDILGYQTDLVRPDGSVLYTDDFLEHVRNEYGFDPIDDPDCDDMVKRLFRFERDHPNPVRRKTDNPAAILHALHKRADGAAAGGALPALARWSKLVCPYPVPSKVNAYALNEDSGSYLAHVVLANQTGFEQRFVEEMADVNMSCGADGSVLLHASDPFDALTLALFEVCRITVLDRLLCCLGTAR